MNLGSKVTSAIRWATSLTFLSQVLMWSVTILVIRILSPEDYGLMSMAMVFVSFAMIVNEAGLGSALVQGSNPAVDDVSAIHGFVVSVNLLLYGAFFLLAPSIGRFFDEPQLGGLIRYVALLFPILGLEVAPLALLDRELRFRRKSTVFLVSNLAGVLTTFILARSGAGVWSIVYGNLLAATFRALGMNASVGYLIIPSLSFGLIRPYLNFGGIVALERILWYVYTRADIFLIGKILGKEALGYYTVAYTLAAMIYEKTGGLLYEISLPTFSNVQRAGSDISRVLIKAIAIISFAIFPIMFGLAAVSEDIVSLLLGDKWLAAVPLVLILCLSMPARTLANILPPALQGIGHPKTSLRNLLIAIVIMVPALVIAAVKGTQTVALMWLTIFPLVMVLMYVNSRSRLGIDAAGITAAIFPPFLASAVMFVLVYWLGMRLHETELSTMFRLAIAILLGITVYALSSVTFIKRHMKDFMSVLRR